MKLLSAKGANRALTLIELLVVLAIIAILVSMILPQLASTGKPTAPNTLCKMGLKQIGVAFSLWASDHHDAFPPQVSITNGGLREIVGSGWPASYFALLSNYVGGRAGLFTCPADKAKGNATNFAVLRDRNISYFIDLDARPELPSAILVGDRNLQVGKKPVAPGLFLLNANAVAGWTREMHLRNKSPGGNVLFADGTVDFRTNLSEMLSRAGLTNNRLAIP